MPALHNTRNVDLHVAKSTDGFLGLVLLDLRAAFGTLTTPSSLKRFFSFGFQDTALSWVYLSSLCKLLPHHLCWTLLSLTQCGGVPGFSSLLMTSSFSLALNGVYMPVTSKFVSPALTSFLNSRFVYPTASLTSSLGCLTEILNELVKNWTLGAP